jgi:hypothetical protein
MNTQLSGLSLWIDDFDDIYSDFDSRHFLKRRVSEDFLHEVQLAVANRVVPATTLVLFLPAEKRNTEIERNIVTSLHNFFEQQLHRLQEKYRSTFNSGMLLLLSGVLITALNFLLSLKFEQHISFSLVRIILEPCSWFITWIGLEKLYYDLRKLRKEKARFQNLAQLKIHFQSSE